MFRRSNPPKSRSLMSLNSICQAMIPKQREKAGICFNPVGYYDENTNVREIDQYVLQYLQKQKEQIPNLQEEIANLTAKMEDPNLRPVERNRYRNEINKKKEIINSYQSEALIGEYKEKIRPFLEEWSYLNSKEGPHRRLGAKKNFSPDKLTLVRNIISIASDYSNLNMILAANDQRGGCPHCRKPFDSEDGHVICEGCGIFQDCLINDADFGDKDRVNNGNKNDYVSRETFDKAVLNYQGKQQVDFPPSLGDAFDKYCKFHQISTRYLTQETTRPIFKAIEYPEYYDHINLFLHEHLGKALHDLDPYMEMINADYDIFSQEYNRVKEGDRSSSLPAQYILYILMVRRAIPCNRSDFRLADTVDIRKDNDIMARRVFNSLKWTGWQDTI